MSAPAVSAAPAGDTDDESRHRQLTVLAGWRRFVDEEPAPPELLPDQQWRRLSGAGRLAYDEARLNHHSRLLVVATPVIRKVITEGRRLSYLNRNADSGRCGLILSGPARTGKTTAITQLGKTLEVIHRQRHPRCGGDIPVIYITVPPAATAKMIAIEFARFLGLPVIRRANLTDIIQAVCGVCADTRTGLVAVDEIRNVSLATRPGAEASDMLKYFSERIPATFVYAGIDVERAGLLSGTRGEQIAGRFGMIRTTAFPRGEYWTALISALEDSLRLHRHQPGALTGLEEYLHRRTGGMIGSLLRLIRGAAIQAVLDGTEEITRTTLDSVGVDIASETTDPGSRRRTARDTRRRAAPASAPRRVRPAAGETTESYIRRLARANHLRPSLLQVYVRNPDVATGAIRLRRLAAVSGSSRTALAFALTGLTPASQAHRPPPSPAESQTARKARLFGIIRDDAARGMSIRQIAGRRHVHRRMVRQALAEPAGPPPRKRGTRPSPAIGPIQNVLHKLAGEPLTIWEIWTTVTDEHDSDASYAAIRDYIRSRRLAGQPGPPPGQITTNDQVQRRLRG